MMPHKCQIVVFVNNIADTTKWLNNIGAYPRIYCGSEFCQYKLIHQEAKIKKIAEVKPVSLVLPVVITRRYFKNIERLIRRIAAVQKHFELVINNFGALQWYAQEKRKFPAVMGRVLCYYHLSDIFQKKSVRKVLGKKKCDYFIKNYNVSRFEISSLPSPYKYALPKNIHISLYFPYALVTMTRKCVFRPKKERPDRICSESCNCDALVLDHPFSVEKFFMVNNGYMVQCNIAKKSDIEMPGIDRYVVQKINKWAAEQQFKYFGR